MAEKVYEQTLISGETVACQGRYWHMRHEHGILEDYTPQPAPVSPETGLVPHGLVRCEACGELRGSGYAPDPPDHKTVSRVTVSCLCDGLICGNCGEGRIHRPISNYYDEETGKVWHVPYFMAMKPCGVCGAHDWREYDESRPAWKQGSPRTAAPPRQEQAQAPVTTDTDHPGGVVLFAGALPSGIRSHAKVYINEAGDLVLEVQDLGGALKDLFGDSDYEWWVVVRASDKPKLIARLMEQQDGSAVVTAEEEDALLLSLIESAFAGRPSAPSDIEKWLAANGIAYKRFSYS
jgi:hypothetical protein